MIPAFAALVIADPHDGAETVAARWLRQQHNVAPAVPDLKAESFDHAIRQRLIAFRTLLAAVAPVDRPQISHVAADADLGLAVNSQPDVALPFSKRHVAAGHFPGPELRLRQGGPGHQREQSQCRGHSGKMIRHAASIPWNPPGASPFAEPVRSLFFLTRPL